MTDLNEIRINDTYASMLVSNYKEGIENESIPKKRRRNVRTDAWLEKIKNHLTPGDNMDLLPTNCRFLKTFPQGSLVVIEEQPAMRTIQVQKDMYNEAESLKAKGLWEQYGYSDLWFEENTKPYKFQLAVPYVIHILAINSANAFTRGKVLFRPKPLLGMGDKLFKAPFMNIATGQGVCYGDQVSRGPRTSITREAEHVIRVFWSAVFNTDYINNYHEYQETPALCDFFTWQYYSQTNPMFIYNADWIPYHKPLGEMMESMIRDIGYAEETKFHFQTLSDMFTKSQVSSKTIKVGRRRKVERNLVFDFCDGHFPEDDLIAYVGDPLMFPKDRVAYIDSFIGIQGAHEPYYVRLQLEDKLPIMRLTNRVNEFLANKIKEIRYESFIKVQDVEYRAGDIIATKNSFGNQIYRKLHYIRKTNDDKIELRIGSDYYFADVFDWKNATKLDMENPEIDGKRIDKDAIYYYYTASNWNPSPYARVVKAKFREITTKHNKLIALFKEVDMSQGNYTVNLSYELHRPQPIYREDELERLPSPFYAIGRTLQKSYRNVSEEYDSAVYRHPKVGIITSVYNRVKNHDIYLEDTFKNLVSEDGTAFHIETNNLTVHFEIGDKVVIANWSNPLDVLKVKTITGFMLNEGTHTIDFVTQDKHGGITNVQYVRPHEGSIQIGRVRKVVTELNGISIGTKIKASKGRITCFPKKDVNIIVAFIVDTGGEPLVLCSNGCTLWFTDLMENFELIPITDSKWKDLNHAPLDPTKIKLQAGDIINGANYNRSSRGYLVVKSGATGIRIVRLDYYHEYDEFYPTSQSFFEDMVLDCIPNPRIGPTDQRRMGVVNAFPNFHGGLVETDRNFAPYKLLNETRRFANVPSVRE